MIAGAKGLAAYIIKIVILKRQNRKIIIKATDQALKLVAKTLVKVIKAVNKAIRDNNNRAVTVKRMPSKDTVLIFSNNADTVIKDKN